MALEPRARHRAGDRLPHRRLQLLEVALDRPHPPRPVPARAGRPGPHRGRPGESPELGCATPVATGRCARPIAGIAHRPTRRPAARGGGGELSMGRAGRAALAAAAMLPEVEFRLTGDPARLSESV